MVVLVVMVMVMMVVVVMAAMMEVHKPGAGIKFADLVQSSGGTQLLHLPGNLHFKVHKVLAPCYEI